jgi:hypothetical protein
MIGRVALVLLMSSAVSASSQSFSDTRPTESGKSSKAAKPTKRDLPRVDEKLGDFIMSEALGAQCRAVQLEIVKARRADIALDRYLLRWEFTNRGDPFGMALPYQNDPTVDGIFAAQQVTVGDCMFFQTALSRAAADLIELQLGDAKLKGARLANARFLETHDYMLQPTVEMRAAQEELVRDRRYRVR